MCILNISSYFIHSILLLLYEYIYSKMVYPDINEKREMRIVLYMAFQFHKHTWASMKIRFSIKMNCVCVCVRVVSFHFKIAAAILDSVSPYTTKKLGAATYFMENWRLSVNQTGSKRKSTKIQKFFLLKFFPKSSTQLTKTSRFSNERFLCVKFVRKK